MGERVVWCVIVSAEGSTPRGVGAKMAVFADGSAWGTVGGGAVEYQVIEYAKTLGERAELRDFDLYQGGNASIGMVCGGSVRIGFLPFRPDGVEHLETILGQLQAPGDSWLRIDLEGSGACGLSLCERAAEPADQSMHPTEPMCEALPGGGVRLMEPAARGGMVYIFGGGHVSKALVPVLLPLGFSVTVMDPRPELMQPERFPGTKLLCAGFDLLPAALSITERDYAVVMTPGHEYDLAVLIQVLRTPASYIGCIGSKRKNAYVNQRLRETGFSEADVARIHAPIGLPIQAKTPEEIAISIAAELILHRAQTK